MCGWGATFFCGLAEERSSCKWRAIMIHRRCCSSVGALIIINQLGGPQADGLLTLLSQAGGPIHQSINHQQRPGHDQHPWASNPGKHPGKFSSGTTPCARLRPWLRESAPKRAPKAPRLFFFFLVSERGGKIFIVSNSASFCPQDVTG